LLAVVYDTFTSIEKDKFRKLFLHKRHAARRAYTLLCSKDPPHWISLKQFLGLMKFFKPNQNVLHNYIIFKSLDKEERGALSLDDFYNVFEKKELSWKKDLSVVVSHDMFRTCPWSCRMTCSGMLRDVQDLSVVVSHDMFRTCPWSCRMTCSGMLCDVQDLYVVVLRDMFRVALVILCLYYSYGIIGLECFSGLKLKNCCK
ncbi:predicted protein, partial [Nematostella vectensis]